MFHRILIGASAALLLAAGSASGATGQHKALAFTVKPVLVKSSGGATLHYQLDRPAKRTHVLIAGRTAKLRRDGSAKEAVYDAFVTDSSLRSGRSYRVCITVVSSSGGVTKRSERLFLHKTFPRS